MPDILAIAIYFIIGIAIGCFYYFVLKKYTLGEFWGASIIGIIGAVLGGKLLGRLIEWIDKIGKLNSGGAIIGSLLLVWIFVLVSPGHHKDRK